MRSSGSLSSGSASLAHSFRLLPSCLAILIGVLWLLGCTVVPYEPAMPPAWNEGRTDGCLSGQKAGGLIGPQFTKNPYRFENEPFYKQGWNDGFAECLGRAQSIDSMLGPAVGRGRW